MLFRAQGTDAFTELFGDDPVFVVRDAEADGDPSLIATSMEGFQTRGWETAKADDTHKWVQGKLGAARGQGGQVVRVTKTTRNPFVGIITVGRAQNNDIILTSASVSKLQAFLRTEEDGWSVEDKSSTNGTFLAQVNLEADRRYPLRLGEELVFGEVRCLFTTVAGLLAILGA